MSLVEIAFDCPHCQAPFVVDGGAAGLETECPECGKMLTIPLKSEVNVDDFGGSSANSEHSSTQSGESSAFLQNSSTTSAPPASVATHFDAPDWKSAQGAEKNQSTPQSKIPSSRSFADKGSGFAKSDQAQANTESTTASNLPTRDSNLPSRKNRSIRDLSSVAKGQTAGRVEQIRGGWRGYCPECGDVFLFSNGDAKRGAELQCTRCFCDIRIHEGDPPKLETLRVESPKKKAQGLQSLPSGEKARNLLATMEHAQMDARQSRQAKDRAVQVSSGKDKWLWLRILILLVLMAIAYLLLQALIKRMKGEADDGINSVSFLAPSQLEHPLSVTAARS